MRYELWHSTSESCYTFFPETQRPTDLPTDATLLWTTEADTWEEAQRQKQEFLGWEPYVPMDD